LSVDSSSPPGPLGFTATIEPARDGLPEARVITCSGELDLSTCRELEDAINSVTSGDLIADLSDVGFMDSTGVSILVAGLQRLSAQDRRFVVVCPPGVPRRVLNLTGLEEMLNARETLADAMALLAA
jgi:anti-anti-sigma factor